MNSIRSEIGRMVHAGLHSDRRTRRIITEQLRRLVESQEALSEELTWNPGPGLPLPEQYDFDCSIAEFKRALQKIRPEWFLPH